MAKLSPQNYNHVNTEAGYIEPAPATLGQRVRAMRLQRGMTQVKLAKAAKMSQPALSSIEVGDTQWLRGHTLVQLAEALEVNPKWLENGRSPPATGGEDTSENGTRLLTLYDSLSESNQSAWLATGMALLENQQDSRGSSSGRVKKKAN